MNECHSNANISAETKEKNNKTIFTELQNFKLDSIFHSFKTAIPTGGISIQANFRNLFSKLSPHCPSPNPFDLLLSC